MTEPEFQQLLQRYLDGLCTPKERAVVEQWYDRLEEAGQQDLPMLSQAAVEGSIWQRMEAKRTEPTAAPEARVIAHPASFWQTPRFRWAASLLLLGGAVSMIKPLINRLEGTSAPEIAAQGWTRHLNTTAKEERFELPDGSEIALQPGSSLRFQTDFTGPKREVYLQGEAFFKVSKNKARPFLVFTNQLVTTVLGTSFRVKAYTDSKLATVAVREGKVSVQMRQGAQLDATPAKPAAAGVLLLPNQQAVYAAGSQHIKKELVDKPAMLEPQAFEFEERPVPEVMAALEKAYGVDIVYDQEKLANCTVSIVFYDEPLFEKLGLLCKSLGAYYTLANEQVIIHSDGCQIPLHPGS